MLNRVQRIVSNTNSPYNKLRPTNRFKKKFKNLRQGIQKLEMTSYFRIRWEHSRDMYLAS